MTTHRRHLFITLAIFLAGWGVALALLVSAPADDALPFELTDAGKQYSYDTERLAGKQAVFFAQVRLFLIGLFHGQTLGLTIGVLASCAALLFFIVATRAPKGP